jgi:hypothetical protein
VEPYIFIVLAEKDILNRIVNVLRGLQRKRIQKKTQLFVEVVIMAVLADQGE